MSEARQLTALDIAWLETYLARCPNAPLTHDTAVALIGEVRRLQRLLNPPIAEPDKPLLPPE